MQFIASSNMRALLVACVCMPLSLAIASIFSTHIDTTVQSQSVLGIPLFLWLWIGVSLTICSVLMWVGSRLSYQDTDFIVENIVENITSQDLARSASIESLEGERHD